MINDQAFFERNPGLDLRLVAEMNESLQAKFSDAEISRMSQFLSATDIGSLRGSRPAIRDLPSSYVALLTKSNGGGIVIGNREIAFFDALTLRDYLVDYQFPVYMPGALPFGLNGGGVFYVFDMREAPVDGEFPILAAASGNLEYDSSPTIAHSLQQLLSDLTNIEDFL
ncbi:SMI1/KNR4 family protein [Massilia pseudoviolaceinigra]|uniref:SMI1/KNR4 family protein n=1 Tax=Massilia pseudoviolaceinigra TaxID=3057165 RepID=UPI00279670C6|nr:SMI1/KNR4 family protein [Massilia sp. CCM 9206]MDQ1924612.1 SMI1/KNR4 family protein [Massilia sp. CCM 9206]